MSNLFFVGLFFGVVLFVIVAGWALTIDPLKGVDEIRIHGIDDCLRVADDTGNGPSDDGPRGDITSPAIMRRASGAGVKCYRADEFPLQHPQSAAHGPDLGGE